ncbi:hypothetical protein [Clostridium pasteurianum]|nr:hypothetical protein [Clostridium pasteurianum]
MEELCPTLVDAVLLAAHGQTNNKIAGKAAYVMGYKETKKTDLGVTNLGIIKMPTQYGKYKVNNIIFVPPAISYAKNIIGISTINDRITITYHGIKNGEENGWFKELVCRMSK